MLNLLEYFKCLIVSKEETKPVINYEFMTKGIILNFNPDSSQKKIIKEYAKENFPNTLFSVDEVNELSLDEKLFKQFTHYYLQSGVDSPRFDVQRSTDKSDTVPVTLIRGISKKELQSLIDDCLYSNKPVKDTQKLAGIIKDNDLEYRINDVLNNELRVLLFDLDKDKFNNGDDVVRYIITKYTNYDLLIKSEEVLKVVSENAIKIPSDLLEKHIDVLSQVFNRHKRIFMAMKIGNRGLASVINIISRKSKQNHIPVYMSKNKTFVNDVMKVSKYNYKDLDKFSLRDKFKILNLLEFKTQKLPEDIYNIRNGKVWVKKDAKVYDIFRLNLVIERVISSIGKDLKHLEGKTIVLPEDIDYGLPISHKQSMGNLPFGTKVSTTENEISSGIYWKNDWGARDIDLSSINIDGDRTGWGSSSGYNNIYDVTFSGDITNAPNGAMEFLTSSKGQYSLFANIFNGEVGCKIEILVGQKESKQWIDKTLIRESINLTSKGNVVGLVQDKVFIAFVGRVRNSRISDNRDKIMIQKALSMKWTVKALFDELGIKYVNQSNKPDYDLSYANFTFDKLEKLFKIV